MSVRIFNRLPSSIARLLPDAARTARAAVTCVLAVAMAAPPAPAAAQAGRNVPIIRDAEIEALLRDYATPIFAAAGLSKGSIEIVIVGDRSFNAFVANGRRMFINTGALVDAKTPNEIIGVIAHESGHIAGGHLARLRDQLATAQIVAIAGMLLGAGAMAGAVRSGDRVGNAGVGASGIMLGSTDMAMRSLLSYQRGEEQAADRMAVNYLNATHQSPKGLLTTFERFNQDAMFKTQSIDPYLVSHPMPAERIANLANVAKQSPYFEAKDSASLQARHDMMRAKLIGFSGSVGEVSRRYPLSDNSLPARYARAIASYQAKRFVEAAGQVDGLIAQQPNNPYFWELKGQILLEFGQAQQALPALRKAVALAPSAGLIRILLGQALVATERPAEVKEAVGILSQAAQRESDWPDGWRHLSRAYGILGDIGMAEYAAAQSYFAAGDYKNAATQATRAMEKLPKGSPSYLRAEDIVNYRPRKPS